jgi:uncharacterized protein YecE (DUF72 family)
MNNKINTHIGTSGWHYDHWRGTFYPEQLNPRDFLTHYAQHFNTAEINNTFYRLPEAKSVESWRERVPTSFIFSVKASRYITHIKRLKEPEQTLQKFFDRAALLNDKLGPILFQLPPRWHIELERIKNFLDALPSKFRYAFEFRDLSGFNEQVEKALRASNSAFCIYDLAGSQSPRLVTADFIYIRLHGPDRAYSGQYTDKQLSSWAHFISSYSSKGTEVYCYFDNDQSGYAIQDALRLKAILD